MRLFGPRALGDGKYDFTLEWNNPSIGPNYFDAAGDVTFRLSSSTESLSADDFLFLSYPNGGHGPFVTAAKVQSIGDNGESGWGTGTTIIPVPGAGVLAVMGLGQQSFDETQETHGCNLTDPFLRGMRPDSALDPRKN